MKNAKRKEFVKEISPTLHMSPKKLTKELKITNQG